MSDKHDTAPLQAYSRIYLDAFKQYLTSPVCAVLFAILLANVVTIQPGTGEMLLVDNGRVLLTDGIAMGCLIGWVVGRNV